MLLWGNDNVLLDTKNFAQLTRFGRAINRKSMVDNYGKVYHMGVKDLEIYNLGDKKPSKKYISDKFSKEANLENGETTGMIFTPDNENLLLVVGRRVYSSPIKDINLQEVRLLADDKPGNLRNVIADKEGNYYLIAEIQGLEFYELGKDISNNTIEAKKLIVDLPDEKLANLSHKGELPRSTYLYMDDNGNLYMPIYNNEKFYIYNPKGINGISSLKGKSTKHKVENK